MSIESLVWYMWYLLTLSLTLFSIFTYVVAHIFHFKRPNNTSLYGSNIFDIRIQILMVTWVLPSFWPPWSRQLWTFMYVFCVDIWCHFFLHKGIGLLDQVVSLSFERIGRLFCNIVQVLITSSGGRFYFLHILNSCCCL